MKIASIISLATLVASAASAYAQKCDPAKLDGSVVTVGDYWMGKPVIYGAASFIAKDRLVTLGEIGDALWISRVPREIFVSQKPLADTPKYTLRTMAHIDGIYDRIGAHRLYSVKLAEPIATARPVRTIRRSPLADGERIIAIAYRNAQPHAAFGTIVMGKSPEMVQRGSLPFRLVDRDEREIDLVDRDERAFDNSTLGTPIFDCNYGVAGVVASVTGPHPSVAKFQTLWGLATGYAIGASELADSLRK